MKIQLRHIKSLDLDDVDFFIHNNSITEIPNNILRSDELKDWIWKGYIILFEPMIFKKQHATIYCESNSNYLYGIEFNKYFKKDLSNDTLVWIEEDIVPKDIVKILKEGKLDNTKELEKKELEKKELEKKELEKKEKEAKIKAEKEAKIKAEKEAKIKAEKEAKELEAKIKAEKEAKIKAEKEAFLKNIEDKTKEEINDFAAKSGYSKEISFSMNKEEMITAIRGLL